MPSITWDEIERLIHSAYIEGIKDGVIMQARQTRSLTEDQKQAMWEHSAAYGNLPETI